MGFWKRVSSLIGKDEKRSHSGAGYDFKRWLSPRNIFATKTSQTLATNETIFSAISRLSNSMGGLPLKLYKDFTPVYTPISDLIANAPNPNMTSFDFIRTLEVHRDSNGNGYAMKQYDAKAQLKALIILDPTRVNPVIEEDTQELWYEIDGDKGRYYVHNMDIIHVKHIHTTGYKGISPIDVLRNTVDFDGKVREFSLEQMDTRIAASFLLKMSGHLDDKKKLAILENFRNFYKDNGGVLIQEQGMDIVPIERKFMDTKVFEVEKITRSRVATVYNLPVQMLGEISGTSYSSMEQQAMDYVQNTLIPIVRQYEQEFNRKLLTEKERLRGLSFKFNVNALLRGDIKTRAEFYFKMIRSGIFKPNEVRAWEELPPEEGGNVLLISGDLYPINMPPDQRAGKGVSTTDESKTADGAGSE